MKPPAKNTPLAKRKPTHPRRLTVDKSEFGPAMRELTDQQQRFVVAYWETDNATEAARMAGYSTSNLDTTKATAWRLTHNPRVKAAIQEFGGNILTAEGVKKAIYTLIGLLDVEDPTVQLNAAKTILDRTGITATHQSNVKVEVTLSTEDKVNRLRELAEQAGVDPAMVLGNVVDLEPEDYEAME